MVVDIKSMEKKTRTKTNKQINKQTKTRTTFVPSPLANEMLDHYLLHISSSSLAHTLFGDPLCWSLPLLCTFQSCGLFLSILLIYMLICNYSAYCKTVKLNAHYVSKAVNKVSNLETLEHLQPDVKFIGLMSSRTELFCCRQILLQHLPAQT